MKRNSVKRSKTKQSSATSRSLCKRSKGKFNLDITYLNTKTAQRQQGCHPMPILSIYMFIALMFLKQRSAQLILFLIDSFLCWLKVRSHLQLLYKISLPKSSHLMGIHVIWNFMYIIAALTNRKLLVAC